MKYDNDNEIRALVGAVVSDLIKAGEPVHFHHITDALFRLSEETRDSRLKALCQEAISFFTRKMH
ncbi:hypothetical protein WKH24_00580 [Pantoea agglomerans]|uniref:Glycogen/starch/alpha-glucan phosphorylase n=1 Tax=Enterobacter agglomerans TaxID=549 RepID=A0ABD6XXU6_ENTAG|nr:MULTISPECIES: hypothetical protein [Pantoea]MBD8142848.1 hypothetical protein [Pantoea agglomerans]MBD8183215.1 hypothetical protein [Pantoea agglomerans]MBD8221534.1 hypothetical protein [Pantoea agglomerans]MBE5683155.1 hypothetical protein [Pantoea agglomerans]MBN9928592.1 hypothetical protein [Pantoea agglomerans]